SRTCWYSLTESTHTSSLSPCQSYPTGPNSTADPPYSVKYCPSFDPCCPKIFTLSSSVWFFTDSANACTNGLFFFVLTGPFFWCIPTVPSVISSICLKISSGDWFGKYLISSDISHFSGTLL